MVLFFPAEHRWPSYIGEKAKLATFNDKWRTALLDSRSTFNYGELVLKRVMMECSSVVECTSFAL